MKVSEFKKLKKEEQLDLVEKAISNYEEGTDEWQKLAKINDKLIDGKVLTITEIQTILKLNKSCQDAQ